MEEGDGRMVTASARWLTTTREARRVADSWVVGPAQALERRNAPKGDLSIQDDGFVSTITSIKAVSFALRVS